MKNNCYKYFDTCEVEKRGCFGCFNEKGFVAGTTRFDNVTKYYIDYKEVTPEQFIFEMNKRLK